MQFVFTPYPISPETLLKFAWNSCICRSSGGFARLLSIGYLAPKPASKYQLTDGNICVSLLVTWGNKSDQEEQIRSNFSNRKTTILTTW